MAVFRLWANTIIDHQAAFSPNFPAYNRLYTASADQTVKIYEATTGVLKRNFNGPGGTAHSNAITSNARSHTTTEVPISSNVLTKMGAMLAL